MGKGKGTRKERERKMGSKTQDKRKGKGKGNGNEKRNGKARLNIGGRRCVKLDRKCAQNRIRQKGREIKPERKNATGRERETLYKGQRKIEN